MNDHMRERVLAILAALLVLATGLSIADTLPEEEEIEEYGCLCDGAQGECRPHPLALRDTACEETP